MTISNGMVSVEDVDNAILHVMREHYWHGSVPEECGNFGSLRAYIHGEFTKPEPPVTLLDPTGGPSMEVPASVVHESVAQGDLDDQHGRSAVKSTAHPEVITYRNLCIEGVNLGVCGACGSVVYNEVKHTEYHRKAASK